jgi:hypothetical protein
MLLVFAAGCTNNTTGWHTIDFNTFKLKAPRGWKKFVEHGVDSYVGGLTNGKDSLWFDYGWYSAEIDEAGAATHLYAQDTINGLIATIQIPKTDGEGFIRLNIPHVNSTDGFSFGGHNIKQTDSILKIFKSLVFKESDTTKNRILTYSKFKDYAFGSGSTLFKAHCSSCHHPTKNTGAAPPLKTILQARSDDWIYKFLTSRDAIEIDSLYKKWLQEAGDNRCYRFPKLTKPQVDEIIGYIKGR